jgi:hypothetical protein
MTQYLGDWQTRRTQLRADALSLLEADPSAEQAQAIVSEVIRNLANNTSETAEVGVIQSEAKAIARPQAIPRPSPECCPRSKRGKSSIDRYIQPFWRRRARSG